MKLVSKLRFECTDMLADIAAMLACRSCSLWRCLAAHSREDGHRVSSLDRHMYRQQPRHLTYDTCIISSLFIDL